MNKLFVSAFIILMHAFVSPAWSQLENKLESSSQDLDENIELTKWLLDKSNRLAAIYLNQGSSKEPEEEFKSLINVNEELFNVFPQSEGEPVAGSSNVPTECTPLLKNKGKSRVLGSSEDELVAESSNVSIESTSHFDGSVKRKYLHHEMIYGMTGRADKESVGISDAVGCMVFLEEEKNGNKKILVIIAMHDSICEGNWTSNFAWTSSDFPIVGKVHKGYELTVMSCFYSIVESIKKITEDSNNFSELSIIVTGHSSGGSMAEIIGAALAALFKKDYTQEDLEKLIRSLNIDAAQNQGLASHSLNEFIIKETLKSWQQLDLLRLKPKVMVYALSSLKVIGDRATYDRIYQLLDLHIVQCVGIFSFPLDPAVFASPFLMSGGQLIIEPIWKVLWLNLSLHQACSEGLKYLGLLKKQNNEDSELKFVEIMKRIVMNLVLSVHLVHDNKEETFFHPRLVQNPQDILEGFTFWDACASCFAETCINIPNYIISSGQSVMSLFKKN